MCAQAELAAKEQLAVLLEGVKGEAARASNALEGEQALVKTLRAEAEELNSQITMLKVCVCVMSYGKCASTRGWVKVDQ
jgi:hypothetical protein